MMLQKTNTSTQSNPIDAETDLKQRAKFVADRICEGHAPRATQRDVLATFGPYPPGHCYGSIESLADEELSHRRLPAAKLTWELRLYRTVRHLQLLVATRVKATERIHELFGIQDPDTMAGIKFQMQNVLSYADMVKEAERIVGELRAMVDAGPGSNPGSDAAKAGASAV